MDYILDVQKKKGLATISDDLMLNPGINMMEGEKRIVLLTS